MAVAILIYQSNVLGTRVMGVGQDTTYLFKKINKKDHKKSISLEIKYLSSYRKHFLKMFGSQQIPMAALGKTS